MEIKLLNDDFSVCKIRDLSGAVSYTHLDVYKRQPEYCELLCGGLLSAAMEFNETARCAEMAHRAVLECAR